MTHYLIGIDDTDNLESRGTGHCVRMLAGWLDENKLGAPRGITRHQLLVDPQIPYTSHNSSACISVETTNPDHLWEACRDFMLREAATGSDVGLCIGAWESVAPAVQSFGGRAKTEVLTLEQAQQTASLAGLRFEGLTGTGGGVIGALAAVGLRRTGNDGRFLWLPGLRELSGRHPVKAVMARAHIDRVCTLSHFDLSQEEIVELGEWVRPVLENGMATLFVEAQEHEWHVLSKEQVKRISD
jgi:hypothetical protein